MDIIWWLCKFDAPISLKPANQKVVQRSTETFDSLLLCWANTIISRSSGLCTQRRVDRFEGQNSAENAIRKFGHSSSAPFQRPQCGRAARVQCIQFRSRKSNWSMNLQFSDTFLRLWRKNWTIWSLAQKWIEHWAWLGTRLALCGNRYSKMQLIDSTNCIRLTAICRDVTRTAYISKICTECNKDIFQDRREMLRAQVAL